MRKSSIAVLHGWGPGSEVAAEVGRRLRVARARRGLTQSEVGYPLTKSYVSALERGVSLPSLGALLLLAERLEVDPGELMKGVNRGWTSGYTAADGERAHLQHQQHEQRDAAEAPDRGR